MGRQAYLTRLALGRSAYSEPFRDEQGNFILGPYAHIYDNKGYIQEWDKRGHPTNLAAKATEKRFRRAQNEVLSTVGVVVRKSEAGKSVWEKVSIGDKYQNVNIENTEGKALMGIDRFAGFVLPWCISSFRACLLTFFTPPAFSLTQLMVDGFTGLGWQRAIFPGIMQYTLASVPRLYRYYMRDPNVEDMVNFTNPGKYVRKESLLEVRFRSRREIMEEVRQSLFVLSSDAILYAIEIPLQVLSALQTLHLLPLNSWIGWMTFVPFSKHSPISTPPIPHRCDLGSLTRTILAAFQTPVALFILRDIIKVELGFRLYAVLRQVFVKPDRPDVISARNCDESDIIDETSIAGIGHPRLSEDDALSGRAYGPKCFWGVVRVAFPYLYKFCDWLSGHRIGKSRGRLSPEVNEQMQIAIRVAYRRARKLPSGPSAASHTFADDAQRQDVVYTAFDELNMDADEELVDPIAWAEAALKDVYQDWHAPAAPEAREIPAYPAGLESFDLLATLPDGVIQSQIPDPDADLMQSDLGFSSGDRLINLPDDSVLIVENLLEIQDQPNSGEILGDVGHPQTSLETQQAQVTQAMDRTLPDAIHNTEMQFRSDVSSRHHIAQEIFDSIGHSNLDNMSMTPLTPIPGIRRAQSLTGPSFQAILATTNRPSDGMQVDSPAARPMPHRSHSVEGHTGISEGPILNLNPTPPAAHLRNLSLFIPETTAEELSEAVEPHATLHASPIAEAPQSSAEAVPEAHQQRPGSQFTINDSDSESLIFGNSSSSLSVDGHNDSQIHGGQSLNGELRDRERLRRTALIPVAKHEYRVTMLSNFAADSAAWHLSALITSLVLLPLEAAWLRSVAWWAMKNTTLHKYVGAQTGGSAGASLGPVLYPSARVLQLEEWFGGHTTSKGWFNYAGAVMLTFGLEAALRGLAWRLCTELAVRKGMSLGWGKF